MSLDRNGVIEKVRSLADAPMTYKGLKDKADAFLEAVDTAEEKPLFRVLIEEVKRDVLTIDQLIHFTGSPDGVAAFGEKKATELHGLAKDAKEKGETTCLCPACQAGKAILENQAVIAS